MIIQKLMETFIFPFICIFMIRGNCNIILFLFFHSVNFFRRFFVSSMLDLRIFHVKWKFIIIITILQSLAQKKNFRRNFFFLTFLKFYLKTESICRSRSKFQISTTFYCIFEISIIGPYSTPQPTIHGPSRVEHNMFQFKNKNRKIDKDRKLQV